ncbi:hypothetical protein [Microvirga massiliensis]|uniref:hypothetical protein n=1 Tax=Microvirga massiliensis TaxID=1033741 RepID=UPI00062BAD72|nr:hypothetical protein [Microvirga massiliensis]
MLATLEITRFSSFLPAQIRPKRRGPNWLHLKALSPCCSTAEIALIGAKAGILNVFQPMIISVVADLESYLCDGNGESLDVTLVANGADLVQTRLTFDRNGIAPLDVRIGNDRIELDLDLYFSTRRAAECVA